MARLRTGEQGVNDCKVVEVAGSAQSGYPGHGGFLVEARFGLDDVEALKTLQVGCPVTLLDDEGVAVREGRVATVNSLPRGWFRIGADVARRA